ncbi:MAG: hypothetical protein OXH50_20485 [Gemmatimonadetes bacterium]|nr:hypothetical protein [Gemmatimonadota bacterium]
MAVTSTGSSPKAICLRINESSPRGGLFEGDRSKLHPDSRLPWRISPEPFWLTGGQLEFLESLGPLLLKFQKACNLLYHQSVKGLQPSWLHRYLDRGKPERVVDFGRMNRSRTQLPVVMRPDLVLTADGVRITELDSVPGGIGFTGQIHALYSEAGYDLIGGAGGLIEGFHEAVAAASEREDPVIAIVVSDESEEYREEMCFLAESLERSGRPVYCCHPRELSVDDEGLLLPRAGGGLRVDVVYRFFELFDLPNIPRAELITYHGKRNAVRITPPLKAFLEEKMWLAFLHYPGLEGFWSRELGGDHDTLRELVPRTWILDPAPVPPHASVSGLQVGGRQVGSWEELKRLTKKERELVVKPSGFSLDAYGSRGVSIGHDLPEEEWSAAVAAALGRFDTSPCILQEFHKGARLEASYYDFFSGEIRRMHGRVLLRPYYYVTGGEETKLAGIQALVCPADKKVLHGMVDAVLVPCAVREG